MTAAEQLRAAGHSDDAEVMEQSIKYIGQVWRDSPDSTLLEADLGDVRDCVERMLEAIGRHLTV
ncbi:hypothetical protein [Amycolatopsis sp. CFH S0078]|uniref:hypothetical protein n=1 Tax=Amycolatopsis sp. CFH S0078 TaxID=1644108 RepID=UPI00106EF00D|nr:hypothetical protein [Amycolatopsis sp. CFH S0078]